MKGETWGEQRKWPGVRRTYLVLFGELSLVVLVDEALVEERHQRIRVDMRRKVELPVWLVDPPLLLQLGGRLSIICGGQSHLTPAEFKTHERGGSRVVKGLPAGGSVLT